MRDPDPGSRAGVPRLVVLFGIAYFAQALGQMGGLLSQPLACYFKEALGRDSAQLAEYLAVLSLPWMIKPLYGLVSDYVPLLGYRRKTWLMLVNLCAATGFLWLANLTDLGTILIALFLAAFGTAASDVLVDALMVENGNARARPPGFSASSGSGSSWGRSPPRSSAATSPRCFPRRARCISPPP